APGVGGACRTRADTGADRRSRTKSRGATFLSPPRCVRGRAWRVRDQRTNISRNRVGPATSSDLRSLMTTERAFTLHAGPGAVAQGRAKGVKAEHIGCVPAAAGGPKGLALVPLDKWLFGEWLAHSKRVEQIGASIGAWRMYAAAQRDAVA